MGSLSSLAHAPHEVYAAYFWVNKLPYEIVDLYLLWLKCLKLTCKLQHISKVLTDGIDSHSL